MDLGLLLKVIGVGLLVAISSQILSRTGRDEQAMLVSVAGIIIVLLLLVSELSGLIKSLKEIFGL